MSATLRSEGWGGLAEDSIEVDPPDFRKYRKILNAITSPAAIVELMERIEYHTTWFIDRIIEQGRCDFAEVIGVPAIAISEP